MLYKNADIEIKYIGTEMKDEIEFNIYVPASDKTIVKEETIPAKIMTGRETILLVDDEKVVLEVNKELLEHMGYIVYAS
jgi:CheY-like chemotaxis protein